MAHFQIPPGTEQFKCQSFSNPFGGMDAEIVSFQAITNEMCIMAGYFYPYSTTSDFLLCF